MMPSTEKPETLPKDATDRQVQDMGVQFARQTGMAPPQHATIMKNAERMESVPLLATAAQLSRQYKQHAPGVDTGAGARVAVTEALSDITGMSLHDAAERVLARVPDAATIAKRDEEFKAQFGVDFDVAEFLMDEEVIPGFSVLGINIGGGQARAPRTSAFTMRTFSSSVRLLLAAPGKKRVTGFRRMTGSSASPVLSSP